MIIESDFLNLDTTYQGVDIDALRAFADQRLPHNFNELRRQLMRGEFYNATEERYVSHCLNRSIYNVVTAGNGKNRFCTIVRELRAGKWLGATGKAITDVVNIGVGGSDLG